MIALREQHTPWNDIADRLGRTVNSCCSRYRAILPESERARFGSGNRWSDQDEATLIKLVAEGRKPRHIANFMGIDIKVVYSKLQHIRKERKVVHFEPMRPRAIIPEHCLIDRDRRMHAERDITAEFFGDPRPGQSALDKKMGVSA